MSNESDGIYNIEYFSGTQVGVFIGEVMVDEITSMSYSTAQSKAPIYGYASQYFDAVSKGHVLVQGAFTINFKEAGYLFLVLDHYRELYRDQQSVISPFVNSGTIERRNIESIVNNEKLSVADRTRLSLGESTPEVESAALRGFSSVVRSQEGIGAAENRFEIYEDLLWEKSQAELDNEHRRADDDRLNPFDIFLSYGDFTGTNRSNHTIEKLADVHITGKSKTLVIDGMPIQEQYEFFARNQI